MAHKFRSIGELEHFLGNMVNYALDNTVKEGVLDSLVNNANIDVYDAYQPRFYSRRYSLRDKESYELDKSTNMKLNIKPVQEFNPYTSDGPSRNSGNELAGLINYGDGWNGYHYDYPSDKPYMESRPFLDHTRQDLADDGFKTLLTAGLEELGINVQ